LISDNLLQEIEGEFTQIGTGYWELHHIIPSV
jgi:hypothetical protein